MRVKIRAIDYTDPCIPGDYTVSKTKRSSAKYYYLVILDTLNSRKVGTRGVIPPQCIHQEKIDSSSNANFKSFSYIEKDKNHGYSNVVRIDSIQKFDDDCISNFYSQENDSIQIDTLYATVYLSYRFNNKSELLWSCDYHYHLKH